jgi:hypothetical protein
MLCDPDNSMKLGVARVAAVLPTDRRRHERRALSWYERKHVEAVRRALRGLVADGVRR